MVNRFLLPGGASTWWATARKYLWLVVERIRLRHSEQRHERGPGQTRARLSRHLLNLAVDVALIASRLHWVLPPVRATHPFTPWPWSRCHCGDLADITRLYAAGDWCSPCAFSGHPSCECSQPPRPEPSPSAATLEGTERP